MNSSQPVATPHPAWPDFVHPHRFVHARAALKADPQGILAARGPQFGETALHWAALGDQGLVMDLVAQGADPNGLDRLGRTPLDWFSDMLWMSLVQPQSSMTDAGADRLRFKAQSQIPALWGQGFRPGPGAGRPPGEIWIRSGVYALVSLLDDRAQGGPGLTGWGEDGATALHAWALADASGGHAQALDDILGRGVPVDAQDNQGRTSLRYAMEAWATGVTHFRRAAPTVRLLLEKGADASVEDHAGVAPGMVPLLHQEIDDKRRDAMVRSIEGLSGR